MIFIFSDSLEEKLALKLTFGLKGYKIYMGIDLQSDLIIFFRRTHSCHPKIFKRENRSLFYLSGFGGGIDSRVDFSVQAS